MSQEERQAHREQMRSMTPEQRNAMREHPAADYPLATERSS